MFSGRETRRKSQGSWRKIPISLIICDQATQRVAYRCFVAQAPTKVYLRPKARGTLPHVNNCSTKESSSLLQDWFQITITSGNCVHTEFAYAVLDSALQWSHWVANVSVTLNLAFVRCSANCSRSYSLSLNLPATVLKSSEMSDLGSGVLEARCQSDGAINVQRMDMNLRRSMTDHERQRVTVLCARIGEERDSAVFLELLIELETLLDEAGWPKSDA